MRWWENLFKPYANSEGAYQPCYLISDFVVRCLDSIKPILAKFKILRLQLASVAEQAGLSLTWSHILKTGPHDMAQIISATIKMCADLTCNVCWWCLLCRSVTRLWSLLFSLCNSNNSSFTTVFSGGLVGRGSDSPAPSTLTSCLTSGFWSSSFFTSGTDVPSVPSETWSYCFVCLFVLVKHRFQQFFSHTTTVCGHDRELNAHFYSAASLKHHAPDTWHDTTPSHITLTLGRSVLALLSESECQARSSQYHF